MKGTTTTHYYVMTNSRGDVEYIYNTSGTLVAQYTYDAWGNVLAIKDGSGAAITSATHIGNINPIRYRGYYYDVESGLYYLNSRYYDAEVGRFISADGYISTGQGIDSNNMFAYCNNNPVRYADYNGESATDVLKWGWLIGAVVSQFDSPVPGPADAIGLTIGIVATVAACILIIPWDSVGRIVSNEWNKVKYNVKTAAISLSISKAVAKAKTKIKNERKRYDYWIASYVEYSDGRGTYIPTTPLSYAYAIAYVRAGGNVFADSKSNAYKLARAVGGGIPARDPAHGGLGYWPHYHATRGGKRIGGHIFYVG